MRIITKPTTTEVKAPQKKKRFNFFASKFQLYILFALSSFLAVAPLGSTNAEYQDKAFIEAATFSTGCWAAPSVPVHTSPADGYIANFGDPFLANPLLNWQDSTTTCPNQAVSYDVEIYLDAGLTNLFQSGSNLSNSQFLSSINLDGTYYWRVRSRDQDGHVSDFTTPWLITISSTTLRAPQMLGWNLQTNSVTAGEQPLDLVCGDTTNGGDINLPLVAHHWTSTPGPGVKYQQEVTYPSGGIGNFFYAGPSYTHFWYLGSMPGIEGLWKVRVRTFVDVNNNGAYDTGELTSAWSNHCNLTLDKNAPATPAIVMNEIYPTPVGDDVAGKPNGEWVELYNRSGSAVDVNGWVLYDADNGHALTINAGNSDNNSNPFDGGETVVPANGFLVVYRNGDSDFDLEDSGDTVRLFNAPIGSGLLKDAHTFGATPEGKSIARIGDGVNNWVDPIGTPARRNVENQNGLSPSINAFQQDAHRLQVGLFEATNYQNAHLTVKYQRMQDGNPVQEQFSKDMPITLVNHYIRDLFLGTVSSSTEYPHFGISQVQVEVVLSGPSIPDRTLTLDLATWNETP
jgi:hypothetical protein